MAQITGKGAPTRKTAGSMGDIYIDRNTGNAYECSFAYRDNQDNAFDCQWKKLTDNELKKKPGIIVDTGIGQTPGNEGASPEEMEKEVEEKVEEPAEEAVAKEEEPAEEAVAKEEEPEQKPASNNRANYASYYGKKNK